MQTKFKRLNLKIKKGNKCGLYKNRGNGFVARRREAGLGTEYVACKILRSRGCAVWPEKTKLFA